MLLLRGAKVRIKQKKHFLTFREKVFRPKMTNNFLPGEVCDNRNRGVSKNYYHSDFRCFSNVQGIQKLHNL